MISSSFSLFLDKWATAFKCVFGLLCLVSVSGCAANYATNNSSNNKPLSPSTQFHSATIVGKWLTESNGEYMQDPQTSGLTVVGDKMYSVSDASALEHQIRRLHVINKNTAVIDTTLGSIEIAPHVANASCFADYLNTRPDYEALVAIPGQTNQWLIVTEDGTRGSKIEGECFDQFANNNFTRYPALIAKLEVINKTLLLTGVRAIEFDALDNTDKRGLGQNIENDGIEGLAFTRDNRLLFGIEQDASAAARVFEIAYSPDMFDTLDSFLKVTDSKLLFPSSMSLINPINGMDVYYPSEDSEGYLIAVARNNDQLWILDLAKQRPAIIVDLILYAPSDAKCGKGTSHKIRNSALEGLAVDGERLFLINDPWRQQYPNNATCIYDKPRYEEFTPLLFELAINPMWFK